NGQVLSAHSFFQQFTRTYCSQTSKTPSIYLEFRMDAKIFTDTSQENESYYPEYFTLNY
ncbi:hypothetical protein HGM15179_012814, partial [Zosterops borbonicus]